MTCRKRRDDVETVGSRYCGNSLDETCLRVLEAVGQGTKMADHLSPSVRSAFPSRSIISERSSPSRVRFAAPNNGAPLTAPGRSEQGFLIRGKGSLRTTTQAGHHFAAILVPFFSATDSKRRILYRDGVVVA